MIWMYELDHVGFVGPRADKLESVYQHHILDHPGVSRRLFYEMSVVDAHEEFRKQAPQLRLITLQRGRNVSNANQSVD